MSGTVNEEKLEWPDWVVIAVYFISVLGFGIWSGRRTKQDSVSGYFLAARHMHWLPVGASLFASCIGSEHFVGLAGSGAATGIGNATFELNAMFVLILLAYVFVPVYLASGVYTMPEYLSKRFGGERIRVYLSVLALLLYVFTKISAGLFSGAIFIQEAMGFSGDGGLYISILILLAIAAVFTITGGLTAVIWTDFVQTIIMLIGAIVLMAISFNEVGGYSELVRKYFLAYPDENHTAYDTFTNQSCAKIPKDAMHLFRSIVPGESDLPWTGVIFGISISAIWYWCSDQVIVQRTLASKSISHAKAGCIMASYLKALPMFMIIFPGMASRVLYPNTVGCADPVKCKEICGSEAGCTNIAYAELVTNLLPPGLKGLMLSVILAAVMSSLTSIFNSSSTILTIDIWPRIRKNPSDMELLLVGRLFVLVFVVISILWIPVIQASQGGQLFVYIQNITSYLAPPVCAVYLLAVFVPQINEPGAFWGLVVGLVIGLIRFGLEFGYAIPACGTGKPDPRPDIIKALVGNVHYLHFGCILFLITIVVCSVVSILTQPIAKEYLYRLTFWSRHSSKVRRERKEHDSDDESTGNTESTGSQSRGSSEDINKAVSSDSESLQTVKQLPGWRRFANRICGVGTEKTTQGSQAPVIHISPEEQAKQAAEFVKEDPLWFRVVNVNAITVMAVSAFLWGWYA